MAPEMLNRFINTPLQKQAFTKIYSMNKNCLQLCALLLFLLFTSCKKTENHSERFDNLVGKWKQTGWGVDSNKNGVIDSSEFTQAPSDPIFYNEYYDNGTGKVLISITGILNDDSYFNWALVDNDQTLQYIDHLGTLNEAKTNYSILSLTSKELIINFPDTAYGSAIYVKE